ncbi:MAG: DUF5312 domain-containing protein [Treponemataceae bacterium]|nr:DUF5312 domain-containing protein [Treponemataceae bacterium]
MSTPNSFETLARGIDADERTQMLNRLNAASQSMAADSSSFELPPDDTTEVERDLSATYKQETIFIKFWITLKSLITGSTQEILYNDMLVIKKGHDIARQYPSLYDARTGTLLNGMFEQLRHIRLVADHFRPAITAYEQNPGDFYVFLGSLLIPELTQQINEEASPFSLPFDREVTGELRLSLIRRLDDILSNIESGQRNMLYVAAQSIDWLSNFCDLPFDKILTRFSSFEAGSYTCPIEIINTDLAAFSRVLCHPKSISMELIAAMYYLVADAEGRNDEEAAAKYREKSVQQLQALKSFITCVPIREITCISYNSAMWYPDAVGGVEDWFVKFKAQWRKTFDAQWEQWLQERKKHQVLHTVQRLFDTNSLFLPPSRPWIHVWGGLSFSRDYTLGYLYAFFTYKYPALGALLKRLAIEGAFVIKENRTFCAEMCTEFIQEEQQLKAIMEKLNEGGYVFESLMKIASERSQNIHNKSSVDSILTGLQSEVSLLASKFAGTCRETVSILEGVLQIKRTAKFDTLTNLMQIGNSIPENAKFREALSRTHTDLLYALTILREVETIEVAS